MKLGFHVSISGGVDKAVKHASELGIDTFQIFTRSPRMWKPRELKPEEVTRFKDGITMTGISPVYSHMPYLPNLATPKPDVYEKSIDTFRVEVQRCNLLEIPYIVMHLGSHLGSGIKQGTRRVADAINLTLNSLTVHPRILLENTSGYTNDVGSTFKELKELLDSIDSDKTGVCLDTCHAYARGYDIRDNLPQVVSELDVEIGLSNIHLIHLNDTKGTLGSRLDRHEHIGLGNLGDQTFRNLLNSELAKAPMIMETPMDERRGDAENLLHVKKLLDYM